MSILRRVERLLLVIGSALILLFVAGHIHRTILSREELNRFRNLQVRHTTVPASNDDLRRLLKVDFSLWSEGRIAAYEESLLEQLAPPLAVLSIPKVHLEVPVLESTDDLALNRGVGHIAGTAYPGENGNIGIAGHRDGFFRGLKDLEIGDLVELETIGTKDIYRVEKILIVAPNDISVLQPGHSRGLTLVTCYPFYFVGSAPQRYIVEASLTRSSATHVRISQSELESKVAGTENQAVMSFKPATQKVKSKAQTLNKEKIK